RVLHRINYQELQKKSKEELIAMILSREDISIPVSLFSSGAPPLECLVYFLREEKKMPVAEIALRLNRNLQTIWTTYRNSKAKKILPGNSKINVPLSIFAKDDKSILESLVHYLKISHRLKLADISRLISRDIRVIYTHYHRYEMKMKHDTKVKK
ncbi:MAG: hypothetical protein HGA85_06795, partial [Nanoarchaeota archaeon]|nr:hypothetical protein [Nanoarchaeota archaeon]